MNALDLARTAYGTPGTPIRTGRSTEYDLFARITRSLSNAVRKGKTGSPENVRALHDNLQLWTTLAVDLADANNGLPVELRGRLFYLAEFTRLHTSRVLAGDATPDVLIEINTSVMRGLAGQAGTA